MTLRDWITAQQLTYKQVAKKLGVTMTYVWQIANGYVKCSYRLGQKIERLTGGQVQAQDVMSDAARDFLARKTGKPSKQNAPEHSRLALAWDWVSNMVFKD